MELTFRFAEAADTPLILEFIKKLADYEHMLDQVVADEATLADQLFHRKNAQVLFALEDGREVGFALFFHNFSTFLGRAGLYLGPVRPAGAPGQGVWQGHVPAACRHRPGAGLRPHGVVVPGLERAQHWILPVSGGGGHERLDRVPPDRRDPERAGGGVTPLQDTGKSAILFKNKL